MSTAARFVHVGFHFQGVVPTKEIEAVFSSALDWLRYDPHCWILYTTTELNIWRDRLKKVPSISGGEFFLCEIKPIAGTAYDGWMKETTWKWLQKPR